MLNTKRKGIPSKSLEIFCAIGLFGFIVAIIALQVAVRYLLNRPFKWPEELAALLLIYLTFLTADIVYKDKVHISIDYFVNFLPERWKHVVATAIYACIGIFFITIIPTSIKLFQMQYGHITAAVITLPKSYWSLPVPIVYNLVRGTNPQPGATTSFRGNKLKIYDCEPAARDVTGAPGEIIACSEEGIVIACQGGGLLIKRVQAQGQPKSPAAEYARSMELRSGEKLG